MSDKWLWKPGSIIALAFFIVGFGLMLYSALVTE